MADVLTIERGQAPGGTAEGATGFKFLKDDLSVVDVNLHLIPNFYIQCTPKFNWQYDSSQLIYFTNNSG